MGFSASLNATAEAAIIEAMPNPCYAAGFIGTTEESASGYARQSFDPAAMFPSGSPRLNALAINFPATAGAYGAWTVIRFYDAASGGNEVGRTNVFTAIASGKDVVHVPAGSLTLSVT